MGDLRHGGFALGLAMDAAARERVCAAARGGAVMEEREKMGHAAVCWR